MAFGTFSSAHARSNMAVTALTGAILGFGGVTAGVTLVHASEGAGVFGFLEDMFRPAPPSAPLPTRPSHKRYASLPDARRVASPRERRFTPRLAALPARKSFRTSGADQGDTPVRAGSSGMQTVCVRTCDGYLFPLGRLGSQRDLSVHRAACAAACPNAPTALFRLPAGVTELDRAVSLRGQPYLTMAWANVYRQKRVQDCSCQAPGVAAVPLGIERDPTIRVGDIVATRDSADVVTKLAGGRVATADYRHARTLSRDARLAIEQRVGAGQRDLAAAAFRRSLHVAEGRTDRIRVAEAGAARLRMMDAGARFAEVPDASGGRQLLAPIRVVSRSVYER